MAFTACLLRAARPWPCRAAPSHGQGGLQCLPAPISISWTSPLDCRLPAQAAPRTGKSEQHLMQGRSRTWLGHRTKARGWGIQLPSPDPSEDRPQECIADPPTQGEPGWRQLWDTPQLAIAHACFQPRAERLPAPLVPAVAHPSLPHAAVLSLLQ